MQNPDYYLPVTIESQAGLASDEKGITFEEIPCQIFLPQNFHEPVTACLELTDGQAKAIGTFGNLFWHMSIEGWLQWGGTFTQIQARKCYIPNDHWPMRRYDCSFQRINLPLEVLDLQVVETHHIDCEGIVDESFGKGCVVQKPTSLPPIEKPDDPVLVSFWLTHNRDVLKVRHEMRHTNGSIEVKEWEPYKFKLLPDVEVTLDRQFRWTDHKKSELIRREDLIVNVLLSPNNKEPLVVSDTILCAIDNFLLLLSFATRWNTICLGWNTSQWPYITKQYRHGRTLPHHLLEDTLHPVRQNHESGIIAPESVPDFLRHAWPLWMGLDASSREMLQQVLQAIVHAQTLDLHSAFTSHYSTLEMMVLHFRKNNDLEFVLSDEKEWEQFKEDLTGFIAKHPLITGSTPQQKVRRKKAKEKISEFNRVAFGTAFAEFCEIYTIPHQDIWPVTGEKSLSRIRNNLVHGVLDGRDQTNAIYAAKLHIEWLVERSVLRLLSWPIENSRVAPNYLTHLIAYNRENWEAAKNIIFLP